MFEEDMELETGIPPIGVSSWLGYLTTMMRGLVNAQSSRTDRLGAVSENAQTAEATSIPDAGRSALPRAVVGSRAALTLSPEVVDRTWPARNRSRKAIHFLSPGKVTFSGVARNFNSRQARYYLLELDVLQGRVEIVDAEGNVVDNIPVRIEGWRILGDIVDGEHISVHGKCTKQGIVIARRVYSERARAWIQPVGLRALAFPVFFYGLSRLTQTFGWLVNNPTHEVILALQYTFQLLAQLSALILLLRFLLKK